MPERHGPRTTLYNRFCRWRKAGVRDRLLDAITSEPLDDLIGIKTLRIVGLDDLRWQVLKAGSAFAGRGKTTRDDSGSGVLYRLARKIKLNGGTKEDFITAIAAAHVATEGERAIDRTWENAPSPRPDLDIALRSISGPAGP